MKQEEYVTTIVVYGKMVNIGMDDCGQQYFIEYVNDSGDLVEVGCGVYNHNYEEVAKWCIDTRKAQIDFYGEEGYLEIERLKTERMKKYETEDYIKERQEAFRKMHGINC
jgi:hypothetical protein